MSLRKILAGSLIALSIASCSNVNDLRLKRAKEVAKYCEIYKSDQRAIQECTRYISQKIARIIPTRPEYRESY